jgi:hypothetical protein
VLAGFNSDHAPNGDINESLSTLWYHDHRVDFTSQNNSQPAIKPAGAGDLVLQFRVSGTAVTDDGVDPATHPSFYQLPSTAAAPRIVRTFKFDRLNGQWSINGQFMDCNQFRFAVEQNSVEQWLLTNLADMGRKDVTQLHPNTRCDEICPMVTANLAKVQKLLGADVGTKLSMYSFTLKPEEDDVTAIRNYRELFHAKPGWTFLTGKPADLERIRKGIGRSKARVKLEVCS